VALDFPDSPSNGDYYNGFVYNSTTGTWKIGGLGTLDLTGGDFTGTQSGYKYHIFTTVGSADLTVSGQGLCEYLVIAGGGAGGRASFGGGAGGLVVGSKVFSTGIYSVTVGAGGASGTANNTDGDFGSDSIIAGVVTAKGGGGGAGGQNNAVAGGGSGGGGRSADTNSGSGGAPNSAYSGVFGYGGPQGHRGGDGEFGTNYDRGGGGGGAGSPGNVGGDSPWRAVPGEYWVDGGNDDGGGGGIGVKLNDWLVDVNAIAAPTIGDLQTDVWYIAGGGAGAVAGATNIARGGYGGGGDGGHDNKAPTAGTDLCGAGGGGSTDNDEAGAGGSGVVIVRYVV